MTFRGARRLFAEATDLDSTFAMAYRAGGSVAALIDRQQAVDLLTKAVEHQDRLTDRERYLTLGTYHSTVTNNRDESIAAYRSMLDADPNDYAALNNLAGEYMEARQFERAEELFRQAIAQDTLELASYLNLVVAHISQGEETEAARALAEVKRRFPESPQVLLIEINTSWNAKDYDSTEVLIRNFADQYPDHPVWVPAALGQRSLIAAVQGELAEATRLSQQTVTALASLQIPGLSLGQEIQLAFYDTWLRGEHARAVQRLEEALSRDPIEAIAPLNRPYQVLAQVYVFADRPDLAREMLSQLEAAIAEEYRAPLEPGRQTILGLIALSEDRPEDAIVHFADADVGRCEICVLPLSGLAQMNAGNDDEAIAAFERYVNSPELARALVDHAFLAFAYEQLGVLHARKGNVADAISWYERFVQIWSGADFELQPRVDAARAAIRELSDQERGN